MKLHIQEGIARAGWFFSFVIGLGLASLICRRAFTTQITLAIPIKELESTVSKVNGKCYSYRVEDAVCKK
jgi:hypothetical protein